MNSDNSQSFYSIPNNSSHFQDFQPSPTNLKPKIKPIDQISIIRPSEVIEELQCSLCLQKEIDCLNIEEVSPEALKEVQEKIQRLKSDQVGLQKELMMATSLLQLSKQRNESLEKQVSKYKEKIAAREEEMEKRHKKQQIHMSPPNHESIESRTFTMNKDKQKSQQEQNNKNSYRQCAMKQKVTIFENQNYTITVDYERKFQEKEYLLLTLSLCPKASEEEGFYGVFFDDDDSQIKNCPLSRGKIEIFKKFYEYIPRKFIIVGTVIECFEGKERNLNEIMIPLPLSKFIEPRLSFHEAHVEKVKQMLSRYTINMPKTIEKGVLWQMMESEWASKVKMFSLLEKRELLYFEISQEKESMIKIEVYGKKSSPLVVDLIEFLCFCLSS